MRFFIWHLLHNFFTNNLWIFFLFHSFAILADSKCCSVAFYVYIKTWKTFVTNAVNIIFFFWIIRQQWQYTLKYNASTTRRQRTYGEWEKVKRIGVSVCATGLSVFFTLPRTEKSIVNQCRNNIRRVSNGNQANERNIFWMDCFLVSSIVNSKEKFRKVGTERKEMMGGACKGSWCVVNTAYRRERLLPYADDNRSKYG